jgi:hypothetical protein
MHCRISKGKNIGIKIPLFYVLYMRLEHTIEHILSYRKFSSPMNFEGKNIQSRPLEIFQWHDAALLELPNTIAVHQWEKGQDTRAEETFFYLFTSLCVLAMHQLQNFDIYDLARFGAPSLS